MTDAEMPPNRKERRLVYRCLLEQGVLIGNEEEVWSVPAAYRALDTLRECVDAICTLIGGRHGLTSSFVKACVMQGDMAGGGHAPYVLDEMAEFLVHDGEARAYWEGFVSDALYPHRCPFCGASAFVGFLQVDCKAKCSGPRRS